MPPRLSTLMAALLALGIQNAAIAQDDTLKLLVEQGNYWQSRGDQKRAAEAWEKLLRADPQNAAALYGMARVELAGQRTAAVQKYLAELRRSAPDSPLIAQLEQEINLQRPGSTRALDEARQAAQFGEPEKAIAKYREALGGRQPEGQIAIEYYQSLGYTDGGWEEGRRGLERLVRQSPDNPQMRLALAQMLSYREATRAQAVADLAELSRRSDIGSAATESWRNALVWLGDPPPRKDVPLFEAYLRANPNDAEIRKRLANVGPEPRTAAAAGARTAAAAPENPILRRTNAAFQALENGRVDVAETEFADVLRTQPNNADAQGGLGLVRLRQQRFPEARDLLQRASRQGSASRWRQALNSASYWALINEAQSARNANNVAEARRLLTEAVKIDPNEPSGLNALAAVQVDAGQLDAAEKTYRQVLSKQASNADAIRGLVGVLSQNGKSDEALQLIARLTPQQQSQIGELGRLRAEQAIGEARAAQQRGDDAGAVAALQDALLNDPNNAWVRLDLARLYLRIGARNEARGVVDGLLASNPDLPDALYASALLSGEMQDWPAALATLDRIPTQARTAEMGELQRRAWVHTQADAASRLAKQGQQQQALSLLAQATPHAQNEVDLLGSLASAYVDAGDPNRALGMMRQLLARTTQPDPNLQLQYAGILLNTNQDVELAGVLRQLQGATLSRAQNDTFQDIRYVYIVRQADALRTRGQLADAYDMLAPALAERPDDALAVGALARLYSDSGDAKQALDIYKRLLQFKPDDTDSLLGAANMAAQAGDYRFAESSIDTALAKEPNNPEMLATAARIYRAQGKNSKAADYLKRAIALQAPTPMAAVAPGAPAAPRGGMGGNPFRNRDGSGGAAAVMPVPVAYASAQPPMGGYVAQPYIPQPVIGQPGPVGAQPLPPYGQSAPAPGTWVQAAPTGGYAPAGYGAPAPQAAPYFAPPSGPEPVSVPVFPPSRNVAAPAAAYPGAPGANPWTTPGPAAAPAAPQTLAQELAEIQQERTPEITMGANVRSREGEGGLSQLTDVQVPLEARLPVGDGRFALRVTPVSLSSDSMGTDFNTTSRFGGGPAAAVQQASGTSGGPGTQDAAGVGVALAYLGKNLQADVGTTPLGFEQNNVIGGVRLNGALGSGGASYAINLSRRAVTDSLLSFAGTRDARTGQRWGAVTATGGRLQLGLDSDTYGIYGYGGYHNLSGRNVVSNSRFEGGFGVYAKLINDTNRELTAGLNFTGLSYDKNLRYFTYGHGGYFSPQRFFSVSVPVNWTQRDGRLSYYVRGSLGIQNFQEDSSLYFPGDAGLQASAQAAMAQANTAGLTTNTQAIYPGQTKTGLGYNLAAAAEYQLAPQLFMGGTLGLDNASDFRQWAGGVYLRYLFEPSTRPLAMPITAYGSPYGE